MIHTDEQYMKRCLQLAANGAGIVSPNPMVGSVIVYEGKIIGEGYHHEYGGPHAEVNAVNSVKDKSLLKRSTLYVNLEPCAHYGKTPPCSLLIIQSEIPRVVIGCTDTFSRVAGQGIKMMQEAGVEVITNVLEKESRELNRRFFTYHERKRPYIILKWAQTRDGYIDATREHKKATPRWISDPFCKVWVHKQRSEEDAILIGTNTTAYDNPSLTVRDWYGKQPLRCVLDLNNRLPKELHVFDGKTETIVFTENKKLESEYVEFITIKKNSAVPEQTLHTLYKKNILSVIVEGGSKLLQSFIDKDLWDEAYVYEGDLIFKAGVKAPVFNFVADEIKTIRSTRLSIYRNQ